MKKQKIVDLGLQPQLGVNTHALLRHQKEQKKKAIEDRKQSWHNKFMELAKHISTWSKDRSTKVGAVIVNAERRVVSMGYNGFPSGINDDIDSRHERPAKYLYTEHAERNAIYNAVRIHANISGCTMYATMFPCADCARAIIQSGITGVVCPIPTLDPNWKKSFEVSMEMFNECNINITII
jgi:dCMP deaminase